MNRWQSNRQIKRACSASLLLLAVGRAWALDATAEFLDMPLEALLNIDVTSAAKKEQSVQETAASVYVITADEIRRSGVTSVPEALRLAPGVQVSRIDANKWAITTRGFNNQFVNMLLVMIDGRTVYSPTISGVYWDAQDTVLEDIDRIEVIRGPGATLWGANAVNGVINIITRSAAQTQGGLVDLVVGNQEKAVLSARYGAQLTEQVAGRIYLKYSDFAANWSPTIDQPANDQWRSIRGGFRMDGRRGAQDNWTVQGDFYRSDENQLANYWLDPADPANAPYGPEYVDWLVADPIESRGWNLLGRWEQRLATEAVATLQIYYDHSYRAEAFSTQRHDTLDIDFQYRFSPWEHHDLIWGLDYRHIRDHFDNTFMAAVLPSRQQTNLYSFFIQDEIGLAADRLRLILGSKFEHNEYTGLETQPTVRLLWLATERLTLWGALSRAVRTPSRVERSSSLVLQIVPMPPPMESLVIRGYGSDEFRSETLLAHELGVRYQPRNNLGVDLVFYLHDYRSLEVFKQKIDDQGLPYLVFDNSLEGRSHGLELALNWQPLEWWRLKLGYSYFHIKTWLEAGRPAGVLAPNGKSSPSHQFSLRSAMDLARDLSLDLWFEYASDIERPAYLIDSSVPAWSSLNLRLAWRPSDKLELSLVGRDLLDSKHLEFVGESYLLPTEIERAFHFRMRWTF